MNELGLYDIYDTWHVPFWHTSWFYYGCLVFILFLVSITLYAILSYLYQKKIINKTSWELALERITELQNKTSYTKDEGKHCYFALTSILKVYIQSRFGIAMTQRTDEEVRAYISKHAIIPKEVQSKLIDIFGGCTLIKFANENAITEQIKAHLSLAKSLIEETIPPKKNN